MKQLLVGFFILAAVVAANAGARSLQILRNGDLYSCNPQTPPPSEDEDWTCTSTESNRTGDLLAHGCKGDSPWACVVTVTESCTEKNSGRQKNHTNTEFLGCSASLGDCF